MHELGHALGLEHGGRDDVNHKPNYLSVMNYHFSPGGIPLATMPGSVLDYSRSVLPTLTEATLDENAKLDATSNYNTAWFDPTGALRIARVSQGINWDQTAAGPTVNVDINADSGCIAPGSDGTLESVANNTAPADDQVVNGIIVNGLNDTCESVLSSSDVLITVGEAGTPLNQICIGGGVNGVRNTASAGDDVQKTSEIWLGGNLRCETTANTTAPADDIQIVPVGRTEPSPHPGWEDWSNLKYRATEGDAGHDGDIDFRSVLVRELRVQQLLTPDLKATKTVDQSDPAPGATLTYTVTAENIGVGEATEVKISDTLPNGPAPVRSAPNIIGGQSHKETYTFLVPCGTPDKTVFTNTASLSAKNLQAQAEINTSNNTASVSSTVRAPLLTLTKSATANVNAGEAITYTLTYANTGSGDAASVVITDTVPADLYYSTATDTGTGPKPTTVVLNSNGSRTLTWNVGAVAKNSGPLTIQYTARPTLLALGGTEYTNNASLTYSDASGCTYPPVSASAKTTITVTSPSKNPTGLGYWRNHEGEWTAENLARLQATDQRFDGADGSTPDGKLSAAEVEEVLAPGGNQPKVLKMQLIAAYFNLATRRFNADTKLDSKKASQLNLTNIRDAALYAQATLALPVTSANRDRYSDITTVLDDADNGKGLKY